MTDIPENVDWKWIARRLVALGAAVDGVRTDIDMLTRITLRLDNTVDALRADVKTLWLSHGDLRRRIEALEETRT
jgi:nicotinic acid phosphoribosyltransferase